MMTLYLNENYECFTTKNAQTVMEVETDAFDGKCKTYVEGMRYVPAGACWIANDGSEFMGEMIAPVKDSQLLEMTQSLFEELKGGMNHDTI